MKCKIIGCSVYKFDSTNISCSIYTYLENETSTHIFLINKDLYKKITRMKKIPSDFASRCITCQNYNCSVMIYNNNFNLYDLFSTFDNSDNEKRTNKRLMLECPCKIRYGDIIYPAKITNISLSGAMIEIEADIDMINIDQPLEILPNNLKTNFRTNSTKSDTKQHQNSDKKCTIQGKIIWSLNNKVGIKFENVLEFNKVFNTFIPKYNTQ